MTSDLPDAGGTHVPSGPPGEGYHPPPGPVSNSQGETTPPTEQDTRMNSPPALSAPEPFEAQQKEVVPNTGEEIPLFCSVTGRLRVLLGTEFHLTVKNIRNGLCYAHKDERLPHVYQTGGRPVIIGNNDKGSKKIQNIKSPESMKEILSKSIAFYKRKAVKDGEDKEKPQNPPIDVCKAIITASEQLPDLKGIVSMPPLGLDGTIHQQPGYDKNTGYYFDPGGIRQIRISEQPTQEEVKLAVQIIEKPFAEFPFCSAADRANYLALLLTLIARSIISGNTPLFVIDSPIQGSGKSKLAFCANTIATGGREAPMVVLEKGGDDEVRKRLTAHLIPRPQTAMIDNITGRVDWPSLAALLTTGMLTDRVLQKSEMVTLKVNSVFIVTGVNVEVAGDMARRCIYIRLDPGVDLPWERSFDFDPEAYVRQYRAELLEALFTMVRYWFVLGKPLWSGATLGSFENWAGIVGGILNAAGIEGFLDNRSAADDAANRETAELAAFYEGWKGTFGETPQRAVDVMKKLTGYDSHRVALRNVLPEELLIVLDQKEGRGAMNFGRVLSRFKNRVAGGLKLIATPDFNKTMLWAVVPANQNAEAP